MSRNLTGGMIAELTGKIFRPIRLVKFEFDSGDVRLWTGYRPLTFNSEIYDPSGRILEISGIQETQKLKASGVSLTLSGVDTAAVSVAMAEDYQGRLVTIWLGAIDANENLVIDPVQEFKGELDVMDPKDNGVEATIEVTAENALVALQRPIERRNTDEDQELDYPGDRFFEFVPGLVEKEITVR